MTEMYKKLMNNRQTLPDVDFSEWIVTVPEYQNMCVQKQYKENSGLKNLNLNPSVFFFSKNDLESKSEAWTQELQNTKELPLSGLL